MADDWDVPRDRSMRPLPTDVITEELRRFARALEDRLAHVADVSHERAEDVGIVEGADVVPRCEGALGVWWMHSAEEIFLGVGEAPGWELARSAESVDVVRAIVEAVVAGHVEVGRGRGATTYRVQTPDGALHEDTHEGLAGTLLSMPWKPRMRWERAAPY